MSTTPKTPLADIQPVADHILTTLRPYCDRIELAGSIRRQRPHIGDIEIVALPQRPTDLLGQHVPNAATPLDHFLAERVTFSKNGRKFKQFKYGRFTVDLFLPETAAHWGCIYTIRTGSAAFSKWLVSYGKRNGRHFKDGRIHPARIDAGGIMLGDPLDTPEEADVFTALNLPYIPLDARDNNRWLKYIKENQNG